MEEYEWQTRKNRIDKKLRKLRWGIVKYSDTDVRKYLGPDEIKKGLSLLQSTLKNPQR